MSVLDKVLGHQSTAEKEASDWLTVCFHIVTFLLTSKHKPSLHVISCLAQISIDILVIFGHIQLQQYVFYKFIIPLLQDKPVYFMLSYNSPTSKFHFNNCYFTFFCCFFALKLQYSLLRFSWSHSNMPDVYTHGSCFLKASCLPTSITNKEGEYNPVTIEKIK